MKQILSAIAAISIGGTTTIHAAETPSANALVWCGLDYSMVKMIGNGDFRQPAKIFPEMLNAWNGLFMNELLPKLESMDKSLKSDLKTVNSRNEKATSSQIDRGDGTLAETDIAKSVSSYELKITQGLGLVFIMDRLVKAHKTGCLYVVFFDISSRKVVFSERVVANGGGAGFRNYWFNPVKVAVERLPKMIKKAKNAQGR